MRQALATTLSAVGAENAHSLFICPGKGAKQRGCEPPAITAMIERRPVAKGGKRDQ